MATLSSLHEHGQSIWLDFIQRSFVQRGGFARLVQEGVGGITSNPSLFEKAIDSTPDYESELKTLARQPGLSPKSAYERIAIADVQDAADVLWPVYEQSGARDGYASLEVSPHLANDARGTVLEARRLWFEVARPNAMIKVPGTSAGQLAIPTLLADGININVTLLFARDRYEAIAQAYLEGLEARLQRGAPIDRVASVASFFVSRIDTAVDSALEEKAKNAGSSEQKSYDALAGKAAIANAKLAYQSYQSIFSGERFSALRAHSALPQRVLWASTGVKSPRYRDVLYIEELIGPNTVTTVPPATLTAFRDHGRVRPSLEDGVDDAKAALDALEHAGISLGFITDKLLEEGIEAFAKPFDTLLATIARHLGRGRESGSKDLMDRPF